MTRRYLVGLCVVMVVFIGFVGLVPQKAQAATIKDAKAYAEIYGQKITVYAKWTYTTNDYIRMKLFHNSIEIKTGSMIYGTEGDETVAFYLDYSPIKAGKFMLQLWSENTDSQQFSQEWTVPGLSISLAVAPTTGQMGTTFVATTTFSAASGAPEDYYFSGTLEINAGSTVFKQNVGGYLLSEKYYTFWGSTDYTIRPIFFGTGFTFPAAGSYSVSAKYTDRLTDISATAVQVSMTDQFSGPLGQMQTDLAAAKADLCATKADLATANGKITTLTNDLNGAKRNNSDLKDELDTTKKDLGDKATQAYNFGMIGLVVGILGMVLAIVAMVMARRSKPSEPAYQAAAPVATAPPSPPTYAPPPAQYTPAAAAAPPPAPPQAAPPGSVYCGRCGGPIPPGVQFCPRCGNPR